MQKLTKDLIIQQKSTLPTVTLAEVITQPLQQMNNKIKEVHIKNRVVHKTNLPDQEVRKQVLIKLEDFKITSQPVVHQHQVENLNLPVT